MKSLATIFTIFSLFSNNSFADEKKESKKGEKMAHTWKTNHMGEDLKKVLNDLQYKVTQNDGTEPAFQNEYWDNHEEGIYVDVVSGEPLFSSTDKFDSGTGWPSFTKPLSEKNLTLKKDWKLLFARVEVRSKMANSHLGHVFDDGPADRGGKRYCMNSAALRFVPVSKMKDEGYGEYLKLFEKKN